MILGLGTDPGAIQPFAEQLPFRVAALAQPGGMQFLAIHEHLQDRRLPNSRALETLFISMKTEL